MLKNILFLTSLMSASLSFASGSLTLALDGPEINVGTNGSINYVVTNHTDSRVMLSQIKVPVSHTADFNLDKSCGGSSLDKGESCYFSLDYTAQAEHMAAIPTIQVNGFEPETGVRVESNAIKATVMNNPVTVSGPTTTQIIVFNGYITHTLKNETDTDLPLQVSNFPGSITTFLSRTGQANCLAQSGGNSSFTLAANSSCNIVFSFEVTTPEEMKVINQMVDITAKGLPDQVVTQVPMRASLVVPR